MKIINKETALQQYKATKSSYLNEQTKENWTAFCNAKRQCMLLGVRI